MLRMFRNQKKVLSFFLWLVIAAFVGTIFLVWGMGGKQRRTNYAMKINDYSISFAEYQNEYEKYTKTLKTLFGDNIPKEIDVAKQVRESLIDKYLLIDEASKKGVFVSDIEVFHEIQKIPAFQTNGRFDQKRYVEILRLNGLTPAAFESSIKGDLIVNKMKELIEKSVRVTDDELKNEYIYRNKEAKISFIKIDSDRFKNKIKFTEDELKAYFEKNKENYRIPEKIKVKYVKFEPDGFKPEVKVSEEEIEKYYLQHPDEFYQKEQVAAKHILIRVQDWNNKKEVEKAKKKAESIVDKLKKGESFEKLAKKYSDDPSAKNGGDLGYFGRGEMIKDFEDAAFKLKKGELSDLVKTKFGYHIIKVYDKKEEKKLTLKEVKEEIKNKIKILKEKSAFNEYVLSKYREILKASNISAYVHDHKDLKVYETDYFSLFDNIQPIGNNFNLKNTLFKLDVAEITNIVEIGNSKYVFELVDKKKSYIPDFDRVKDTVRKDYIDDKSVEMAKDFASKLLSKYKTLKKISDSEKLSITTTPYFKRDERIPDIGVNSDLTNTIFKKDKGSEILSEPYIVGDYVYIVKVDDVVLPDFEKISDTERGELTNYILSIKRGEAVSSYLEYLKNKAKIEINPSLL